MKVLFLTRLYHPHIGGIEKHIEKISDRLIKNGYEITVLTTKHEKHLKNNETVKKVKIVRFPQPSIKYFGLLITWFYMIKNIRLFTQSDIIHIHDVFIWYWPIKILIPRKNVYLTIHGRWGEYPIPFKDVIQKRIAVRFTNGNICAGKYIPKHYGIKHSLITYGGVDDFKSKKIKKEKKTVLYVGRLDRDIELIKVIKTFEKLKGFKFEFCGDGELKKECMKVGRVHGWVDPMPYYQKASFCIASGYLTILEALSGKCLTFALYGHALQKDYYLLSPFPKYIGISSKPELIKNNILKYSRDNLDMQKKVNEGYDWAVRQTWGGVADLYASLWGIKS